MAQTLLQNFFTISDKQFQKQLDDLHDYRTTQRSRKQWGITKLCNKYFHKPTSQLFKLHTKLDAIALQAYSFKPDDDLLEKLLILNLELAEKEKRGEAIVDPWAAQ